MSAPTIAPAAWAPRTEPTLLSKVAADARTQLAAAPAADTTDYNALAASHAALQAVLRRVLWVLNEEEAS